MEPRYGLSIARALMTSDLSTSQTISRVLGSVIHSSRYVLSK